MSVLIPVHPHKTEVKAAAAANQFDYPREKLEILIVRTTDLAIGPGVKRNAGLKAVHGELVYFLDDDSVALPDALRRAVKHFEDPAVKMVGGPNVCPPDAPPFERALGLVMGSWLAFGPSCARYRRTGKLRSSGEKELISCNLVARREAVLEVGFDPKLWPNEENAMMDGVQKRGGKLLYDPELVVQRRPRPDLRAYAKMLLFYGGGRAQQLRLHPTLASLPNFVPALLCLYFVALPFAPAMPVAAHWSLPILSPLLLYMAAVVAQTVRNAARGGWPLAARALPLLVLTNLFYGLGFWRGLFVKIAPPPSAPEGDIRFETVPARAG
ncbi:MAG: glycosyltransferase [Verrucomicrobiota bacterium]|nr:glycosyltransferase [Verrucomicrobiota bacterium]